MMAAEVASAFGVHFGTTNVCLALYRDGRTDVVANDAGDRVTPAVVAFVNGEKAVGIAAKQGMARNASSTVTNVKQLIGKTEVPPSLLNSRGCKIISESELKYEVENNGRLETYTPDEVTEFIFRKMLGIAQSYVNDDDVYPAVMTVPFYFNHEQKCIIRDAATKAGFTVLRVISEPAAAALAYRIGQNHDGEGMLTHCLVYRVGGLSLDATVLRVSGGLYHVAASIHRPSIGGNNLTQALVDHCVQEFHRQYKLDITESRRSLFKLWHAADMCKHSLSSLSSARCFAESVHEGVDLNISITRARFESLISNLLREFLEPVEEVLRASGVSKESIHKIVLCGGSTKVPRLQRMMKDFFPSAEVLSHIAGDEVIAIGAAEQAALLNGKRNNPGVPEDTVVETLTRGIYLKIIDSDGKEKLDPVIWSGTPIPTKATAKFSLPEMQDSLSLDIYEGRTNGSMGQCIEVEQAEHLARMVMEGLNASSELSVAFHVKSDGSLHVTCTEKASGRMESIVIDKCGS